MSPIGSNILAGASGQGGAASGYEISKGLRFNSADSSALSRAVRTAGNRKTWTWSGWVKRSTSSASAKNVLFEAAGNGFMFGFDDGTADVLRIEDNFYTGGLAAKTTAVFRDFSAWYHIVLAIDTTQASSSDGIKVWVNNVLQTLTSVTYTQNYETLINDATTQYIGGNLTWSGRYFNGYIADVYFIDGTALEPSVFGEYDTNGIWQPKETTGNTISAAKESNQPYNTRDNMAVEWTSSGSNSNFASSGTYQFSHLFNGVVVDQQVPGTAGLMTAPAANSAATWTYTISDAHTFQVRIYVPNASFVAAGNVKVNGNDITQEHVINAGLSNDDWHTLTVTGLSGFTSFEVNSYYWYISTIWINGRQLVDGPANNSKIWSTDVTPLNQVYSGGPADAFDGNISSTYFSFYANQEITLLTGESISASSLKVYANVLSNATFKVNGSTVTDDADGSNKWITLTGWSSPITSLTIEDTVNSSVRAVKIDDNVLVDSPVQWNASKHWSGMMTSTGSGIEAANPATSGFDGVLTGLGCRVNGNSSMTWTPTGGYAFTDSVIIYCAGDSMPTGNQFTCVHAGGTLDFSSSVTTGSSNEPVNLTDLGITSPITSITIASGVSNPRFSAIQIDHKVLVDGGWGRNGFHLPFNDSTDIGKDASVTAALDPRGGFGVALYTGSGASTVGGSGESQVITSFRFQPDLVIIKQRNYAHDWNVIDSVRETPNLLLLNSTAAEITNSTDGVLSLDSNGFTLGPNSLGTQSLEINKDTEPYVTYGWKGGGRAVSNSDGSITSQVSANQTYGFSVVSYTGSSANATIGHGLNAAPKVIWLKRRDGTTGFYVYHNGVGATKTGYLYGTSIFETYAAAYNDTAPTSSVFSVGSAAATNSGSMIAYCWSEVTGFSKFGSYTSSGSANYAITTGFKPAFVLIKCYTTAAQEWCVFDAQRNPTNPLDDYLYTNSSSG